MGFFRGAGLTILSIILFVVLLIGGIFASLSLSLEYKNVQPRVYTVLEQFVGSQIGEEQIKNEILPYAISYCQTNDEWVQEFDGYVLAFPCSVVLEGYDSFLNYGINQVINDFYYKEYTCNFLDCFKEQELPLFLISEYSQKFWKNLFIKFLIFSIVLFGLIILLVKKKPSSLILLGSLMVPVSLFLMAFKKAGEFFIASSISGEGTDDLLSSITGIFFSESSMVFSRMLILGGVLIVVGIILRIVFSKSEEVKDQTQDKVKEIKSNVKSKSKPKAIKKKKK